MWTWILQGKFSSLLSKSGLGKLAMDSNIHYVMYSLGAAMAPNGGIIRLSPLVLFSLYQIALLYNNSPVLPASLGGYLSAFLNAHESLFRIIAQIEVTQVFIQAVMLCIGGTSLTDVLLLANFIWLRYAVSSFVRETIGLYTNPYLDSPNTPGIVRSIPQKFKALAPSPQQPS